MVSNIYFQVIQTLTEVARVSTRSRQNHAVTRITSSSASISRESGAELSGLRFEPAQRGARGVDHRLLVRCGLHFGYSHGVDHQQAPDVLLK